MRANVWLVVLLTASSATGAGYFESFTPFASGGFAIEALSGDGSVLVGRCGMYPFRWSRGEGYTLLPIDPDFITAAAFDASAGGNLIVGQLWTDTPSVRRGACYWTGNSVTNIGDLPGGFDDGLARACSADGTTIVGRGLVDAGQRAFRWTEEAGMQELPSPVPLADLGSTSATGVNEDGGTVCGTAGHWSDGEYRFSAYVWTNGGGSILLPKGNHRDAQALDLSSDGTTVVGITGGNYGVPLRPVLWGEDHSFVELPSLSGPSGYCTARRVSGDGSLVVGYDSTAGVGTVWDAARNVHDATDYLYDAWGLDLNGRTIKFLTDVSDDGLTVAGLAISPTGETEGFVAHIPEPAPAIPMALAAITVRRRRLG